MLKCCWDAACNVVAPVETKTKFRKFVQKVEICGVMTDSSSVPSGAICGVDEGAAGAFRFHQVHPPSSCGVQRFTEDPRKVLSVLCAAEI